MGDEAEGHEQDEMMFDFNAVYVIWLREMKRFSRSKSRVIGLLAMPVFFLVGLGLGFNGIVHIPGVADYLEFLVPGIIGMSLLFISMSSGIAVLWDRQFGFLKEIMVTPNSRTSIVLGRIAGGATTAMIQAVLVIAIAVLIGFTVTVGWINLVAIVFMFLLAVIFISLGLTFGSFITDFQGFSVIMNFITFPLFFLSGAIFPVSSFPGIVQYVSYVNPLTYGVDGLRGALTGTSMFPMWLDVAVLVVAALIMVAITALAFERTET